MIKKITAYVFLLLLTQNILLAQPKKNVSKISEVENGLSTAGFGIDSTGIKFNIYDRMQFHKVPSVSITVINNEQIDWSKSYGFADIKEKRSSAVNTIYQVASISKSLNALAVMRLYENGKLSLDKDIRFYLKSWLFPDNEYSKGKNITIANLLSHTAGLSTSGFAGYSKNDTIPTLNEILDGKKPANSKPVIPVLSPNTKVQYSGGGITIIRKILEDNITSNYANLMQKMVLKPLKMTNSSFAQPLTLNREKVATAYDENLNEVEGKFNVYPELAPDGLWSTSDNIAKFVVSIQSSLSNKKTFLKKETAQLMITPYLPSSNTGLGVFILQLAGEQYFAHTGRNLGYTCIYLGGISNGKGVVILTNSDNGEPLYNEILSSVAKAYDWHLNKKK